MDLDDLPNRLEVQCDVGVRGDVPEAVDRPPADLRISRLEIVGQPAGRVGQRLETTQNRILDDRLPLECLASSLRVLLDARDALADVPQPFPFPLLLGHRGTDSRRRRSAVADGRRICTTSTL